MVVEWAGIMTRVYPSLCLLFAIPNGGYALAGDARQRAMVAAKLRAEGMRPGVPDMCLPVARAGFSSLFIEHKSEEGTVKPEQQGWHDRLREFGNKVVLSRSFDESRRAIIEYLESN